MRKSPGLAGFVDENWKTINFIAFGVVHVIRTVKPLHAAASCYFMLIVHFEPLISEHNCPDACLTAGLAESSIRFLRFDGDPTRALQPAAAQLICESFKLLLKCEYVTPPRHLLNHENAEESDVGVG